MRYFTAYFIDLDVNKSPAMTAEPQGPSPLGIARSQGSR